MRWCFFLLIVAQAGLAADFSFSEAQGFFKTYCQSCHGGNARVGGFSLTPLAQPESIASAMSAWNKAIIRVRNREMPPKGRPAPSQDELDSFLGFAVPALRAAACQNGPVPGPYPMRRLSRDEYGATVRDLLNIHINAG